MPRTISQPTGSVIVGTASVSEPLSKLTAFLNFCDESISPTINELNGIAVERNRINLQKLVYVHLVNRKNLKRLA